MQCINRALRYYVGFTVKNESMETSSHRLVYSTRNSIIGNRWRPLFLIKSIVEAFWKYDVLFVFTNASFPNVAFETFIRVVKNKLLLL